MDQLKVQDEVAQALPSEEKKPTPLNMERVTSYKAVNMSRLGEEGIEFELKSKKNVIIPLSS